MTAEEKLRAISHIIIDAYKAIPAAAKTDNPYFGIFTAIFSILTFDTEEA